MTTTLHTAAGIRQCANELIACLRDLPDATGDAWTQENFRRLKQFSEQRVPGLRSYYRKHQQQAEFLWDFIASAPETGIFLAAESEQGVDGEAQVRALKHDFEKLLYVYSPIRVLITKARDRTHADELAASLSSYAHGCCLNFNPGAVFILHFGLWHGAGNLFYLWQSTGNPGPMVSERVSFERTSSEHRHCDEGGLTDDNAHSNRIGKGSFGHDGTCRSVLWRVEETFEC